MRPHCPGSDCALIILLSSSNKAVEEINGYGSRAARELRGRKCAWEKEQSARPVSLTGRKGRGRGGRKEGREKEGREDHMVGWLPPLAECGYIPVRLFRKL